MTALQTPLEEDTLRLLPNPAATCWTNFGQTWTIRGKHEKQMRIEKTDGNFANTTETINMAIPNLNQQ